MKAMEKIAGVAAFVQAVGFVLVLLFVIVLLPGLGIGPNDSGNAAKVLAASASPVLKAYYPLVAGFGLTLVLITLGVNERLQGNPPGLLRLAIIAATVGGTLWIAYGMIGASLVATLAGLDRQNVAAAGAVVPAVNTVLQGVLNAAPFASALAITLWGAAAVRTGDLPKSLSYLVIVAGVVRLVSYLLPLPILNLVQLALSIGYSMWLGIVLLRPQGSPRAVNAPVHRLS